MQPYLLINVFHCFDTHVNLTRVITGIRQKISVKRSWLEAMISADDKWLEVGFGFSSFLFVECMNVTVISLFFVANVVVIASGKMAFSGGCSMTFSMRNERKLKGCGFVWRLFILDFERFELPYD